MAKEPKSKGKVADTLSFFEKENVVNALTYFPFAWALVVYLWKRPSKGGLLKNIKYSGLLAVGTIVLCILLNTLFTSILNIAYLGVSIFFAWKAYNGEKIKVEILDTIEGKISEKVKK